MKLEKECIVCGNVFKCNKTKINRRACEDKNCKYIVRTYNQRKWIHSNLSEKEIVGSIESKLLLLKSLIDALEQTYGKRVVMELGKDKIWNVRYVQNITAIRGDEDGE